eukprot:scaffold8170_cov72-Isochrysis_galbana.AAC.1
MYAAAAPTIDAAYEVRLPTDVQPPHVLPPAALAPPGKPRGPTPQSAAARGVGGGTAACSPPVFGAAVRPPSASGTPPCPPSVSVCGPSSSAEGDAAESEHNRGCTEGGTTPEGKPEAPAGQAPVEADPQGKDTPPWPPAPVAGARDWA